MRKIISLLLAVSLLAAFPMAPVYATNDNLTNAIQVVTDLNIFQGYEDGSLQLDKTITRAEFTTIAMRLLNIGCGATTIAPFEDVKPSDWYCPYILAAKQQNIIHGVTATIFEPNSNITFEQAVKIIICLLGYQPKFANIPDAYPTAYIAEANMLGITKGINSHIGMPASRKVIMQLVYNSLDVPLMEQTSFGTDIEFTQTDNTILSKYLKVYKCDATVENLYFDADNKDKISLNIGGYTNDFDIAANIDMTKGYAYETYINFEDEDEPYVVSAVLQSNKNKTLVLSSKQMKNAAFGEYYKIDSETDSKPTKIKLEDDIQIYINKNAEPTELNDAFKKLYTNGEFYKMTFIDNNNNGKYDYVIATYFTSGVIDTINARTHRIVFDGGNAKQLTLDPDADDYTFDIKAESGAPLTFADLEEDTVLNIFKSTDSSSTYYEIIVSNKTINGRIAEVLDNGNVIINGKECEPLNIDLAAGDTGVFVLDLFNRILKYDITKGSMLCGLAYKFYYSNEGVEETPRILILTNKGYVTYDFAKNIKTIDGIIKNQDFEMPNSAGLCTYSVNAANEITEIYYNDDIKKNNLSYISSTGTYRGAANKLGSYYITDSTVIVSNKNKELLNKDKADYEISSESILSDENDEIYDFVAIYNTDKDLLFLVINNSLPIPDKNSAAFYITSVGSTVDSEGATAVSLTGYENGEKITLVATYDTKAFDIYGAATELKFNKGDVIQYAANGDTLNSVRFIVQDGKYYEVGEREYDKGNGFLRCGYIDEIKNSVITLNGVDITFKKSVPAMLVRKDSGKVYCEDIDLSIAETNEDYYGIDNDDMVLIYKYDDESILCVIYDSENDTEF